MSRKSVMGVRRISHLLVLSSLGVAVPSRAQTFTNNLIPVVSIQATDPLASWSGTVGTFTVFREGPTNATLNVYYRIGGTASNGLDYAMLSNWVMLPAGIRTNTITVSPINNGQSNIETVVLKLADSPLMPPINYSIGYPSSATVFITPAGVTNIPPLVRMFSPTNGAVFFSPANVPLGALAYDPDGSVSSVEFFAGTNSLGVATGGAVLDPPFPDGMGPGARAFFLVWSNVPAGDFALTAKATDNGGASSLSAPIKISVQLSPPTNIPPAVRIEIPENGAMFSTPVNLPICAGAYDLDGYVATVEFFAGTNSLGIRTNNPINAGPINPFCMIWSNVPPGTYVLTAKATDNGGASRTSDPIKIAVQQGPPPPPPTNYPPVVRIASPPNGAAFRGAVDLPIYAYAKDPDGQVVSVEFFAGTNSLGLGKGFCLGSAGPSPFNCPTNIFVLVWSNAPVGSFVLTAVATDNSGASTVSSPVNITILPPPPPPTNRPPIVSIVATDPLAIEGTNCWPWLGLDGVTPTWGNWTNITFWRFFTNCGPKNATFTVRRYGDTNQDLLVTYDVGGSATNGVDYVALPGSVTIPAGERRALLTVVPIDDGTPDINSTVILKLTPSTNYVVGLPQRAAALILDSQLPRPATGILPDKSFELTATGPDGAWFRVEFSRDLLNWASICTNQVVNGAINFVDPDARGNLSGFYRAVPEMSPPSD